MASPANDTIAAFTGTFDVADRSSRDYQRLALQQQAQLQNQIQGVVQKARQNKADDLNLMMKALDRQDRRAEAAIDNARQDRALDLREDAYNNPRSRSGSNYSDDPLGLSGPPVEIPGASGTPSGGGTGFTFGGKQYGGNWGRTRATVFGGGNDPDDNGLSAFGGKTGAGGREGVAIPEKVLRQTFGNDRKAWENALVDVTLEDGTTKTFPVADLGTSEFVWEREGGPVLDLTPGAAKALGGEVVTDARGNIRDVRGIKIANVNLRGPGGAAAPTGQAPPVALEPPNYGQQVPKAIPMAEVVQEETITEAPVAGTGSNLSSSETLRAFAGVPMPDAAPTGPALLPPPQIVPSITQTDISQDTRNTLFNLERETKKLAKESAILQSQAVKTNSYLARGNLRDPEAYRAKAEEQQIAAIDAAGASQEAAARAGRIKEELPRIQKRQEVIASIADLDTVLPPAEKAALVKLSSDPATGGQADRQLNMLSAYSKVRQERGLDHASRGLKTAEMVARTGANLATADALKEKEAYDEVALATASLKDTTLEPEEIKDYKKRIRENAAKAAGWGNRVKAFGKAVDEDRLPDPPTTVEPSGEAPAAPAAPAAAPVVDLISEANNSTVKVEAMAPADQSYWSESKEALRQKIGGDDGIRKAIVANGGVKTLADLKLAVRKQVASQLLSEDAETNAEIEQKVFRQGLPRNAKGLVDVADALAEDIWRASGRADDKKAVKGAAPMSAEGRTKVDDVAARFEKKPAG